MRTRSASEATPTAVTGNSSSEKAPVDEEEEAGSVSSPRMSVVSAGEFQLASITEALPDVASTTGVSRLMVT